MAAQKNAQPKRMPFSAVEEGFIREGERKYRHDKLIWAKILAEYPFPPGRTSVNIKDKWRNMCKNK